MAANWPKVFRDPVHNLIAFDDTPVDRLLLDLINAPEVQRLRRVKQMGVSEIVFPGANHSRFAHSLGVLHTARMFVSQLERCQGRPLPEDQRALVLCAALLHDVGHGPFSHVFEQVTGRAHEAYTLAILQDPDTAVNRCLRSFDAGLPEGLARFFDDETDDEGRTPAYLKRIVSGQLDADRCDYLLRDSHATGTNYGDFDLAWMLAQLRPDPARKGFYLTRKGLAAAETYLFARYHMYRTVYFHKTSRAAEVMLKLLFRRVREVIDADRERLVLPDTIAAAFSGQMSLISYLDIDDHSVSEMMKSCARSADKTLAGLASGLLNRRLYKSVDVSGLVAEQQLGRIMAFRDAMAAKLRALGLEPGYAFVEDSASDTPYEPYEPDDERPSRQILVEASDGRIVEISHLSDALLQLRKTYTVMRYYAPAELRDEMIKALADTARRR
ncbi:MAG: HD domain-containing protein [Gemmataceae bacterium]